MKNHQGSIISLKWNICIIAAVFELFTQGNINCFAVTVNVPRDFATIQAAVNQSSDGDSIVLSRGVYQGSVDFKSKNVAIRSDYSGNSPSADDIGQTIIEGIKDGRFVVTMSSAGQLTGLTVRGGSAGGVGLAGGKVQWCRIVDNSGPGVSGGGGISDSSIESNRGHGLYTFRGGLIRVERCRIFNNFIPSVGGGWGFTGSGIYAVESDILIQDSVVYGNAGNGVNVWGGFSMVNCAVANNAGVGVECSQTYSVVKVLNSIIYGNQRSLTPAPTLIDIDYSIVQGGKEGVKVPYERLLQYGLNNSSTDPKFVSPSTGDFRLRDDSPAIGAGGQLPVGVSGIRNAEPTGSALDIGAFENTRPYPAVSGFAVFGLVNHNLCSGDFVGAIRLYVDNGIEPLSYNWTGPNEFSSTEKDVKNLGGGTYVVTVNGGGKILTSSFLVREPAPLALANTICGSFGSSLLSVG